jgi:anti-sigma factor RsiW
VDGELSELESALLEAHLGRCPACAFFADRVEVVALEVRAVSFERPDQPISLPPGRTASPLRAVQLGAAVLVAAAAGLGTVFGAIGSEPPSSAPSLKLSRNAALLARPPRDLPTAAQIALQQKPRSPIPRNLAPPGL